MKKDFSIIRGSTLSFNFVSDEPITKAYFSAKKTTDKNDTDYVFQKTMDNGISFVEQTEEGYVYVVRVAPEDTNDLDKGSYYYDLQLDIIDDSFTPLIGKLKIENDVTREL